MKQSLVSVLLLLVAMTSSVFAGFQIPENLTAEQATRFKPFETFYINGVCGEGDYDRLSSAGVNTVRGYTIKPVKKMLAELDSAQAHGIKMIVSEWMPNHGENKGSDGTKWVFDYTIKGDEMVDKFLEKVNEIGEHPAILMWGLGNEVHLDGPYLRTVNRMSQEIHRRFPQHLTSLTMVNAKPENIEKIKTFAPDLDVIGVQSYSVGAVRGGVKNMEEHWKKPFYYSEFNGKGPWNFNKTDWGVAYDETTPSKLRDLKSAYDAIEGSSLCLGSTIFVWGYFTVNRPTYFSLFFPKDPKKYNSKMGKSGLLMTPQAEYVAERFTGKPFEGNRAPLLTDLKFSKGEKSVACKAGQNLQVSVNSEDPDGDPVFYKAWYLDTKYNRAKVASGPFEFNGPEGTFAAPSSAGSYLIMVYALDGKGGVSASTIPVLVK